MTTTQSTSKFGYIVMVEGEQAASEASTMPDWFDGDLERLGAWVAWRWLTTDCQVRDDAACPVVTVKVTVDGATGMYRV